MGKEAIWLNACPAFNHHQVCSRERKTLEEFQSTAGVPPTLGIFLKVPVYLQLFLRKTFPGFKIQTGSIFTCVLSPPLDQRLLEGKEYIIYVKNQNYGKFKDCFF
jgi:hypothetical protein